MELELILNSTLMNDLKANNYFGQLPDYTDEQQDAYASAWEKAMLEMGDAALDENTLNGLSEDACDKALSIASTMARA